MPKWDITSMRHNGFLLGGNYAKYNWDLPLSIITVYYLHNVCHFVIFSLS